MNRLDEQYKNLLLDILKNGHKKGDRTGTGTISVFGRTIRHNMADGFPLLTTKKMAWKQIVTELMWFLRGEYNIQSLVQDDNYIWVGDAYKYYKKVFDLDTYGVLEPLSREQFIDKIKNDDVFAQQWGDMGPIYGKQWRKWTNYTVDMPGFDAHFDETSVDQIKTLIHTLKTNPDSRRMMVSAWNVADLENMKLPPCHYGFQVYTRELTFIERLKIKEELFTVDTTDLDTEDKLDRYKIPKRAISLKWNQRSVDTPLGLPFNIASYGLLLLIIANEVNMIPEELIGDLGDTHIYINQIDGVDEQVIRKPFELPKVFIRKGVTVDNITKEDIELVDYKSHSTIKFPLSN